MRKVVFFFGLIVATLLAVYAAKWIGLAFSGRQITSIGIFTMFIYGTLLFGEFRLAFAFGGIALLMVCGLLSVDQFIKSASLDVIVFLIGTFLVIGFLEENQFFEHLVSSIVKAVGPRPQRLLLVLMMMGSLASALVGEVTAILFMAGAMLHLTSKYRLNPVPFIIMLVFSCNIGSAMSSVGNPIGVLIALKTGLTFLDFLKWSAPTALIVNAVTYLICRWWFADAFAGFEAAVRADFAARGETGDALDSTYFAAGESNQLGDLDTRRTYMLGWVVLMGLILLLVTHGLTDHALGVLFHVVREVRADGTVIYGLKEGTMMVGAALIMGCVVLLIRREKARELVERRVDWWTLSFFMMLFASVGTLEDTHVTAVIAERLRGGGSGQMATIQIIGWATGWLSAFLDNVLAVATFMPIVHDIRAANPGPYSSGIYWFMLFGGTFMGNMTIIGSTANIVAVGLLEKRGHGTISFGYWMKVGFVVSIASMLVATVLMLLIQHTIGMPQLRQPPPMSM